MYLLTLALGRMMVFDCSPCGQPADSRTMGGGKKETHRGKAVTRWNVQPLRTLDADVYPTPPTGSAKPGGRAGASQKTRRRSGKRRSKD